MKHKFSSLPSLKISVLFLANVLIRNRFESEKWIFSHKDFYHVHVITPYGVIPLFDCFDFAFLSYALAARYASMFCFFSNKGFYIRIR